MSPQPYSDLHFPAHFRLLDRLFPTDVIRTVLVLVRNTRRTSSCHITAAAPVYSPFSPPFAASNPGASSSSLQLPSSAATSTDSLGYPGATAPGAHESPYLTHVERHHDKVTLLRPENMGSRRSGEKVNTIYTPSAPSGVTTSTIRSSSAPIPATTSTSTSTSTSATMMTTDIKGKGRATLTPAPPIIAPRSRGGVPLDIAEAVRNAGLTGPPPAQPTTTTSSRIAGVPSSSRSPEPSLRGTKAARSGGSKPTLQHKASSATLLTVPGSGGGGGGGSGGPSSYPATAGTANRSMDSLYRTVSTGTASTTSLPATVASGSNVLLQQPGDTTANSTTSTKKKKKKKKEASSTATASKTVNSSGTSRRAARPIPAATTASSGATYPPASSSANAAHPRRAQPPAAGYSMPINREILSQRPPEASNSASHSAPVSQSARRGATPINTAPSSSAPSTVVSSPSRSNGTLPATQTTSNTIANVSDTAADTPRQGSPPPPAWSAPLTTITLAYTPMHAYITDFESDNLASAFVGSLESTVQGQQEAQQGATRSSDSDNVDAATSSSRTAPVHPLLPDSPPPAFRSRPPTPERVVGSADTASDDGSEPYLSDVDASALPTYDRGYASSENEEDLLRTRGREQGVFDSTDAISMGSRNVWQVRHWEAWRREGLDPEERWRRLQTLSHHPQNDALTNGSSDSTPASRHADTTSGEQVFTSTVAAAADVPRTPSPQAPSGLSTNLSVPKSTISERSSSPPSNVTEPRQPSIGTVRRARLRRFEAERQNSKRLSSVLDPAAAAAAASLASTAAAAAAATAASKPAISITQPKQTSSSAVSPLSALSTLPTRPSSSTVAQTSSRPGNTDQVTPGNSAGPLPGGDGSKPTTTYEVDETTQDSQDSATETTPTKTTTIATEQAGSTKAATSTDADPSEAVSATVSASQPQPKLAQRLAAEIEARRRSREAEASQPVAEMSLSERAPDQADDARRQSTEAEAANAPAPVRPQTSSHLDLTSEAAPGVSTTASKPTGTLRARIPRSIRSNILNTLHTSKGKSPVRDQKPTESSPKKDAEPVMTLPRAPPRVTTDPLSTDNLRKLSRQSTREPSLHSAHSLSSSSSDSDHGARPRRLSTVASESSDSDSDSADDESTMRRPASSLVSYPSGAAPPSVGPSQSFASNDEREAAAASWRRSEDGRRYSAILSRPLSVKRKPPPVPPKRWAGIWDREAVGERIRQGLRMFENRDLPSTSTQDDARTAGSSHKMPGSLPEVTEEPTWETVGQIEHPRPSRAEPSWPTYGQDPPSHSAHRPQGPATLANPVSLLAPRPARPQPSPSPDPFSTHQGGPHIASSAMSSRSGSQDGPVGAAQYQRKLPFRSDQGFNGNDANVYHQALLANRPIYPGSAPPQIPSFDFESSGRNDAAMVAGAANASTSTTTVPTTPDDNYNPFRSSLQRSHATRRPTSAYLASSSRPPYIPRSSSGNTSISDETRVNLANRPRHVYSSSLPNASPPPAVQQSSITTTTTAAQSLNPFSRRPLPIPPVDLLSTAAQPPVVNGTGASNPFASPVASTSTAPSTQTPSTTSQTEYTELDDLLSKLDDNPSAVVSGPEQNEHR